MAKHLFIDLSRKDLSLGSYFLGLELKNNPCADWIETVLVPLILPIAGRKAKAISQVSITFWVFVRETARFPHGEIFVFVTPAYPGTVIERALTKSLQAIPGGNILTGRKPIPEEAYPCCQIFRGKLISFYIRMKEPEGFYLPVIHWLNVAPVLCFLNIHEVDTLVADLGAERLLVLANINQVLDGNYYRRYQQALKTIARDDYEQPAC